jgi:hypothetical protein
MRGEEPQLERTWGQERTGQEERERNQRHKRASRNQWSPVSMEIKKPQARMHTLGSQERSKPIEKDLP